MADGLTVPSRLGQIGGTGDANALFLKVFSNEVLTTFEEANVMKNLHTVRTISSGKSAQFPVMGKASAKYHIPGEDVFETLDGSAGKYTHKMIHKERIISIDDVLIAATSIANIDELKNHYDVRSAYSTELGRALAKRFDYATMKTLVAAAETTAGQANPDAGQGISIDLGTTVGAPNDLTSADKLIQTFRLIAQKLDENDIPSEDRFVILTPELYYLLAGSDSAAINRDFGGAGSIATGKILNLVGLNIYSSNHLQDVANGAASPADDSNVNNNPFDDADGGAAGNGYNDSGLTTIKFVAGHKSAIGTVKLMDLAVESEYSLQKQSTLMLAKYAMGHGILRPEAAVKVIA